MKNRFTKESATALFYIVALLITYGSRILAPNAFDSFNLAGLIWIIVFMASSFILFFVHVYRFFKKDKSYVNCLLIHALAWSIVFAVEYFNTH